MIAMKKILGFVYAVVFILVLTFLLIVYSPRDVKASKLSFISETKNKQITVEIADSPMERAIGLMNRDSLDENSGMIFVFNNEGIRSFWMMDTLKPLDMIFVSQDLEIVHIHHNVQPCVDDPCKTYSSIKPAKYVVEVNGGFAEEHGIKIGDKIFLILAS